MSDDRADIEIQRSEEAMKPTVTVTPAKLTDEQGRDAVAWLRTHVTKGCPSCDQSDFTVAGIVHALPWANGAIVFGSGGAVPLVLVVCNVCALTQTYSAVRMELISREPR